MGDGLTAEALLGVAEADWARLLAGLGESEAGAMLADWPFWARPAQLAPAGDGWRVWLVMAGRGFGKTRAGAEWVRGIAEGDGTARIALVGATMAEARAVMVEGDNGLLAIAPADRRPLWQPSLNRLRWLSGAQATLFSAAKHEGLRGPQHSHGWCDEIAKWAHGEGRGPISRWGSGWGRGRGSSRPRRRGRCRCCARCWRGTMSR